MTTILFSADGRRFASFSQDGMVRIWSDDLPHEPSALRAWLTALVPADLGWTWLRPRLAALRE